MCGAIYYVNLISYQVDLWRGGSVRPRAHLVTNNKKILLQKTATLLCLELLVFNLFTISPRRTPHRDGLKNESTYLDKLFSVENLLVLLSKITGERSTPRYCDLWASAENEKGQYVLSNSAD